MTNLNLIVSGPEPAAAADTLMHLLQEDEAQLDVSCLPAQSVVEPVRRSVDPIALAALVLSFPSAVLAVADLTDRWRKRRKAERLVREATLLRIEGKTEILIVTADGPQSLADLSADKVLEIARSLPPSDRSGT